MGEFLRGNPESSEDEQRYDQEPLELAVNSLSRVVGDQDDVNSNSDVFEEEDDYDDDCGEEDDYDDCYSEYEEQHYGEERADFDEEKLVLKEMPLPAEILEHYSFLSELPHGVAVMGGVARSIT